MNPQNLPLEQNTDQGADTPSTPNPVDPANPSQPVGPLQYAQPPAKSSGWPSILSTVLLFLLAPIIAISLSTFVLQSYQVDGQSMETTLQNNDRLIVDKLPRTWSRITGHSYLPARGNIIIFNAMLFDLSSSQQKQLIKRVIGLPGERVVVKDGAITVYNKAHPGGFDPDKSGLYTITAPATPGDGDWTLQNNEIFVCGDNRPNSEDSRYFGPVNLDQIVGKLSFRIIPLNKMQHFSETTNLNLSLKI